MVVCKGCKYINYESDGDLAECGHPNFTNNAPVEIWGVDGPWEINLTTYPLCSDKNRKYDCIFKVGKAKRGKGNG